MKKQWIVILGLAILLGCQGNESQTETTDTEMTEEPQITEEIPTAEGVFNPVPKEVFTSDSITLNVFDYEGFSPYLDRKDGEIHVINFWATWCVPCVKELPYFEQLNENYPEITMTLVSLDFYSNIEAGLIPFIKREKLASEVIMLHEPDADAWIPKVDSSWTGAIPATVIYRDDRVQFYEQSFTYETLEEELKTFLE